MLVSLRAEWLKLRKRHSLWLIFAAWLVMSLVFGYLLPYLSYRGVAAGPGAASTSANAALVAALPADLVPTAIQGFPLFAGALALVVGALAAGSEYGWQTVKVMLTQGPRRPSLLAGKISALLLVMLVIVVVTFAVDAGASLLIASITHKAVAWPAIGDLGRGVLAGWLIVGMWALGGLFLGVLLRGTALAVGIGLVWALAVENLIRAFASTISAIDVAQKFFPGTNAGALAAALGVPSEGRAGGVPGITTVVSGIQASLVLLGYLVVFAVVSVVVLNRRDVA